MLLPLHSLSLVRNSLASLESSISLVTTLLKLDLSHNALTSMPRTIQTLVALRELRIASNRLESLSTSVLLRFVRTCDIVKSTNYLL